MGSALERDAPVPGNVIASYEPILEELGGVSL